VLGEYWISLLICPYHLRCLYFITSWTTYVEHRHLLYGHITFVDIYVVHIADDFNRVILHSVEMIYSFFEKKKERKKWVAGFSRRYCCKRGRAGRGRIDKSMPQTDQTLDQPYLNVKLYLSTQFNVCRNYCPITHQSIIRIGFDSRHSYWFRKQSTSSPRPQSLPSRLF
jgi:hypothetical protein